MLDFSEPMAQCGPGARVGGAAAGPERAGQARDFDRVASRRSGAVRFDVLTSAESMSVARKRSEHHFSLAAGLVTV